MTRLISCAEAGSLDGRVASAWRLVPGALMEVAATVLWTALEPLLRDTGPDWRSLRLVALAGPGNNGGDALTLLRHARFAGMADISAVVIAREGATPSLGSLAIASLRAAGIPVVSWDSPEARALIGASDMLIDGIAGTGLRGGLAGQSLELVRHAAASTKRVIAIDLPSGLRDSAAAGDAILPAFWTLAIEPRKQCLYAPGLRPLAGRIVPVGGVFPIDASFESRVGLFEDTDWTAQSVDVPAAAHKGQRGRLAVLAGSPGMAGSALLAIRAAQASGAGLVTLFVESGLFPALAAASPEVLGGAIVRPELAFEAESPGHNAVLVGPGWATSEEHGRLLASLLASGKPLVIDASALRLLARLEPGAASSALVLTPHPGEMAALAGYDIEHILSDPAAVLPALARRWRAAVILKAATSWMADREGGLRVLEGNEAGLGVAGSGDVLAGVVAGLLAGFAARSPGSTDDLASKALGLAAFAHLRAGRRARAELGWFNAVDLIPRLASSLGLP